MCNSWDQTRPGGLEIGVAPDRAGLISGYFEVIDGV